MKLADLAAALGARFEGDGAMEVTRPVHPAEAEGTADLALAMDKALVPLLETTRAGAAMVAEGAAVPEGRFKGWIVVNRPRFAMAGLTQVFDKPVHAEPGIHPSAFVATDAVIGEGVSIGPFVYVGPKAVVGERTILMPHVTIGAEARVGADCLFHPGARVGERCVIGNRVILHHNASIGGDGFSYVTPEPGSVETAKATGKVGAINAAICRINSLGAVILDDDVEVGANAAIDRGTISDTRVGRFTKIDNLVQIGHNVQIGQMCMICGHAGIAGSVEIGNRVVLAGRVGVADHVRIGDDAVIAAMSGVGTDVPAKSVMMGYPAIQRSKFFEQFKMLARLPRLFADVAEIKKKLS
ncbi:MAG TPA: UDP-3-O-(3-hydroxymyristoyl)glucosamine N-acyltransferase [Azospirillaceae bacterium]|nr:UDP-3-O-(3-hydroxymyristoyl)glucosamine N-acyltransferase [Azospirillaceae bacterium]